MTRRHVHCHHELRPEPWLDRIVFAIALLALLVWMLKA